MPLDHLPRAFVCAASALVLLYAPGRALIGRGRTALPTVLPTAFARVLASVIVSTLTATALAIAERFSLPALLGWNLAACALLLLLRQFLGRPGDLEEASAAAPRDLVGPAVFALALAAYWPAYPAFIGASDSTAYVATGISLAHHGTLAREDELGPTVPLPMRAQLFDSMSQVLGSTGPPYRRMPGAMMVDSMDATRAWPCFFPVPSVWAAIFVAAGAPGGETVEESAPGFAPLFAALALWSFWYLARQWLGPSWGLLAVVLLGASGPFYVAAKLPLSEPIAAYFALAGLAITSVIRGQRPDGADADDPSDPTQTRAAKPCRLVPCRLDALLAGASLGAAVFTRIDMAIVLAMAFAMLPSLQARRAGAPAPRPMMPPVFFVSLLCIASLTIVQVTLLPGTYVSPLLDHLHNAWVMYVLHVGYFSFGIPGDLPVMAAVLLALLVRWFGLSATLRWGFVFAVLLGHAAASKLLAQRTSMWLSFYIGWTGLALAAVGALFARRDGIRRSDLSPALAVAAAAALILFYNPHVYPSLPWGARRFVPLLLPLLVLLACHAAARTASRSRLLSLAFVALLAFPIVQGGQPVWGERLMEGAWSQLDELAAAIPEDAVLLIDREVSAMMVGPALWLIHDRNNVSVPPTSSAIGLEIMPQMVSYYATKRPMYFVTRGAGNQVRPPKVRMELVKRVVANLRLLEQNYDTRPERIERYVMPLAVYRLGPGLNPHPGTVE